MVQRYCIGSCQWEGKKAKIQKDKEKWRKTDADVDIGIDIDIDNSFYCKFVAMNLIYVAVAILAMFYLQKNCDITVKGLLVQVRFSMKCDSIANYKTHESELSQQCDLNKSHQVLV